MAVKKYLRRKKRRKAEAKAQPFFQSDTAQHEMAEGNSFFSPMEGKVQTKMKVSEPGDKQEQEADRMANTVVHKKGKDDEMQRAPMKEEEKISKKNDEEKVSKKTSDEDKMQKKEEEKVDKKGGFEKKGDDTHDRDQLEDPTIATKKNTAAMATPSPLTSRNIKKDGGTALPASIVSEMSHSFGYDFSKVKIHTDKNAEAMSEQLNAQAFTYKGEIYFNKDKYNTLSEQGKWLLAHELTHVIQQSNDLSAIQRKDVPGISTPVPKDFKVTKKEEVLIAAEGEVKGVKVVVKPDQNGDVPEGKSAKTGIHLSYTLPAPYKQSGKVTKVTGQAVITLIIQTTFKPDVDPSGPSKFGRGTTAEDKKSGNISLRFHEGTHGSLALDYVSVHSLPVFTGKVGDTVAAYDHAIEKFKTEIEGYSSKMLAENAQSVDCSGTPEPGCAP